MEQLKNKTLEKIQKSSRIMAWMCVLGGIVYMGIAAINTRWLIGTGADPSVLAPGIGGTISKIIHGILLFFAASVFFRIQKSGVPFTEKNFRSVRLIGILLIASTVLSQAVIILLSGGITDIANDLIVLSPPIITGILFLFIAKVFGYGAMLQRESDETL